jgi:ribonuclease BN (tRNA processing enzyme)
MSSTMLKSAVASGIVLLALPALAQSPSPVAVTAPPPKIGTHIVTLGTTAGPLPRKDRAQASNLLIVNGTPYLIDAGDGAARRVVQSRVNFLDVTTVFITHNHSDHTAGLATLLNAQWEYAKRTPTNVYGPPGTERLIAGAIQYFTVNAETRSTEEKTWPLSRTFVGHDVAVGLVYADANIRVTAVENTHFHFAADNPFAGQHKSYSYRFQTPDKTIVFTGDTGPSDAVTELAKGADVLVSEVVDVEGIRQRRIAAGQWQKMSETEQKAFMFHMQDEHLTPDVIGRMATKAGVKTVILTHLPATPKEDDDYSGYVALVKQHFTGEVKAAADLMMF